MQAQRRVEYMDVYRGIAILLMVMGHVKFGRAFDHYIHAFHMPMWFFVSGYFFADKGYGFGKNLLAKAKKLLIPYAVFGMLHYWIAVFFVDSSQGLIHAKYIRSYLLTNFTGLPITGGFWFLTCLLIADMFFLYLRRWIRKEKWFAAAAAGISLAGVWLCRHSSVRLPWTADAALAALFFYYCGYAAKNRPVLSGWYQKFLSGNILWGILLAGVNAWLIFQTAYVNMRAAVYPNPILFYMNGMAAILVYLKLCSHFVSVQWKPAAWLRKWLCFVGKNSMIFLCLNQLVIWCAGKIVPFESTWIRWGGLLACMIALSGLALVFRWRPLCWVMGNSGTMFYKRVKENVEK